MSNDERGLLGVFLSTLTPTIEALNPILQFAGAALGIVLVLVSIWHKILQVKSINKK